MAAEMVVHDEFMYVKIIFVKLFVSNLRLTIGYPV